MRLASETAAFPKLFISSAAPEWRPMHFKVTSGSRLSPQGKCRWSDVGNFQRVAPLSASTRDGQRESSHLKRPLLVGFSLGQNPSFSLKDFSFFTGFNELFDAIKTG